jgi:hypothetical protein
VLAVPLVLAVPTPVRTYDPYAKGNGQAGKSNIAHLYLVEKNPSDWMIVPDGAWGKMKYNLAGPTFDFVFNGHGLEPDTSYTLIYYADPWPGNNPGAYIASGTSDNDGNIHLAGSVDLGTDIPNPSDGNYPLGGKIWLVLSNDYNSGNAQTGPMTGWNPTEYLFEYDLIKYDDTDV